ncbi:MAG: type III-B CRISPR module RAMP protein Cmr1 [Pseudomonadota bacterium]|nr:type III-B CRISPR module RAMP protein Cmr1 [Pseudomonadota bacterium]
MITKNGALVFTFTAKTNIWTGDANGKANSLKHTGLLGSIRWWFEVVVRGLGGYACDPLDTQCQDKNHCVVCELFGCTGWGRKFRFDVVDECCVHIQEQITEGMRFKLMFTPLRPIKPEEWALLGLTLKLIVKYGAIGGKTVFKPSDEGGRENRPYHVDYGILTLEGENRLNKTYDEIKKYAQSRGEDNQSMWASLENFWYVSGRYLTRENKDNSSYNRVLGRNEAKSKAKNDLNNDNFSKWLAGRIPGKGDKNKESASKKIFSFKNPVFTFGFIKPGLIEHDIMKKRLKDNVWPDLKENEYISGTQRIIEELMKNNEN